MADPLFSMKVDTSDAKLLAKQYGRLGKQEFPFATVLALTRTAVVGMKVTKAEIDKTFHSGKAWMKRGVGMRPAIKKGGRFVPESIVYFKNDALGGQGQSKAIKPHITGGRRELKSSERLLGNSHSMPARAIWIRGNAAYKTPGKFGGQVQQILSLLRSTRDEAQGTTTRSRQRNTKLPTLFTVTKPGGPLPPGVWQRHGRTKKNSKNPRKVKPLLIFSQSQRYKARFPFDDLMLEVYDQNFEREFRRALQQAINTSWKRSKGLNAIL